MKEPDQADPGSRSDKQSTIFTEFFPRGQSRKRIIAGIAIALVIGALGSGLWEYVIDPALRSGRDFVLNVGSWGVGAFKNGIYRDIGTSVARPPTLREELLRPFGLGLLLIFNLLVLFYVSWLRSTRVERLAWIESEMRDLDPGADEIESPENAIRTLREWRARWIEFPVRKLRWLVYVVTIATTLVAPLSAVSITRARYIRDARGHFELLFIIAAPYLREEDEERVRADFAQVVSESDYREVVDALRRVLAGQGITPPAFGIW